eukprot:9314342-Pyramimonas_sp.AAC.4
MDLLTSDRFLRSGSLSLRGFRPFDPFEDAEAPKPEREETPLGFSEYSQLPNRPKRGFRKGYVQPDPPSYASANASYGLSKKLKLDP